MLVIFKTFSSTVRFCFIKQCGNCAFQFTPDLINDSLEKSWCYWITYAAYTGYRSGYSNGILYANGEHGPNCNKGRVLTSFMEKIGRKPSCIVFIDDRKKNLEDLQKTFENTDIKFLGILYTDEKEYEEVPCAAISEQLTDLLANGVL